MPVAYPSLDRLVVIGDRRTAAMVAADGTIVWCCLPNYNGSPIFGSLLDAESGGYWQLGSGDQRYGIQSYRDNSALPVTRWEEEAGVLEVTDLMPWPQNERPVGFAERRVIIRRARAVVGCVNCEMVFAPKLNFQEFPNIFSDGQGTVWTANNCKLRLWSSIPTSLDLSKAHFQLTLEEGEEVWLVLDLTAEHYEWTREKAQRALEETESYWHDWNSRLTFTAQRRSRVFHTARLVHLLSFAPSGSLVAAPTSSLPERIGGERNYDYRYAWLRDASLSLASLSMLGDLESSARYMDWLVTLGSTIDAPLQPLYQIDGNPEVPEQTRPDIGGYRGSQPVRFGNDAYKQYQPDSFGYFAECALIYLQQGGHWKVEYWQLVQKLANFVTEHWQRPSHGIWELHESRHYVSSKVMSWVTLDRAVKIAEHLQSDVDTSRWRVAMTDIHQDVMSHGWSEKQQCFLEHYEGTQLDASVLLISVMDFLPPKHPRLISTFQQLEKELGINGLLHRFDPQRTLGPEQPPLGEFEGAFMPTTFFLATAYAKAGLTHQAEAILTKVETSIGETGLIPEEIDARTFEHLGNTPLVFSLVEYIRAVMTLDQAKPLQKMALMAGMLKRKLT